MYLSHPSTKCRNGNSGHKIPHLIYVELQSFKNILPSAAANKAFISTTETLTGRIQSIIKDSNKYMYVHGSQHRVYYMGCNVMNINCFCSITVHTSPHHVMETLNSWHAQLWNFQTGNPYCKQENAVCNNTIFSFLILSRSTTLSEQPMCRQKTLPSTKSSTISLRINSFHHLALLSSLFAHDCSMSSALSRRVARMHVEAIAGP